MTAVDAMFVGALVAVIKRKPWSERRAAVEAD
jgi:hypothetical protein